MNPNGADLFHVSFALTPNLAFLLPRQTSITQMTDLAKKAKRKRGTSKPASEPVEVEETYLNDRLKMLTIYYGSLVNHPSVWPTQELQSSTEHS